MAAMRAGLLRTALQRWQLAVGMGPVAQAKPDNIFAGFRHYNSNLPLHTGRQQLLILGSGWAGCRLLRDIDTNSYDVTVVSPRNHMVFTPLLASCCTGTLESRSVAVSVMAIQPALHLPQNKYYAADVVAVDHQERVVECRAADGTTFYVDYDVLAIATGAQGSTFGIPGVHEHVHFLRDVRNADDIRSALLANWMLANVPGRSQAERQRLLHVVVVGGGPTGVEFAGELAEFINSDLASVDPDRARDMRITLVEAAELLGSFDVGLREYAARKLTKAGVHLRKGVVREVRAKEVALQLGGKGGGDDVIPYGLLVWSTGVGPTPLTTSLPFAKTARGRVAVDEALRVLAPPVGEVAPGPGSVEEVNILTDEEPRGVEGPAAGCSVVPGVYALGDCCANVDTPLPALAQVAEQQGRYLAKVLNARARMLEPEEPPPFVYKHIGSMATVGRASAVLELGSEPRKRVTMTGLSSWVAWRSAYLTRLGTLRNRIYVAVNWTTTLLFGRDISRW